MVSLPIGFFYLPTKFSKWAIILKLVSLAHNVVMQLPVVSFLRRALYHRALLISTIEFIYVANEIV